MLSDRGGDAGRVHARRRARRDRRRRRTPCSTSSTKRSRPRSSANAPASWARTNSRTRAIRQTLYNELNTPRRLHRQIGEALEAVSVGEPPLGELAYHWFQAAPGGASAKALEYATRAAEQAMAQVAYEEAARSTTTLSRRSSWRTITIRRADGGVAHGSRLRPAPGGRHRRGENAGRCAKSPSSPVPSMTACCSDRPRSPVRRCRGRRTAATREGRAVIEEALEVLPKGEDSDSGPSCSACSGTISRSSTGTVTSAWPTKRWRGPPQRRLPPAIAIAVLAHGRSGPVRPPSSPPPKKRCPARRGVERPQRSALQPHVVGHRRHDRLGSRPVRLRRDRGAAPGRRVACCRSGATATSAEALAASVDGRYDDAEALFAEQLAAAPAGTASRRWSATTASACS